MRSGLRLNLADFKWAMTFGPCNFKPGGHFDVKIQYVGRLQEFEYL